MNKTIITASIIAILGTGALAGTQVASAQTEAISTVATPSTVKADHMASLVQKLATKFGVSQDEVQAVFDQDRQERQALMEAEYESQLNQAVADGQLTETQKQQIISKRAELQATHESKMTAGQAMTETEHKTAMEAEMTALKEWASSNDIDLKYLMPMGFKGGPGHGDRMFKIRPASTDSATTTP